MMRRYGLLYLLAALLPIAATPVSVEQLPPCGVEPLDRSLGRPAEPGSQTTCIIMSPCDYVDTRADYFLDPAQPTTWIKVRVHIIGEDDGSNLSTTAALIDAQMAQLNSDFAPFGIQFEHDIDTFYNTAFRYNITTFAGADVMKAAVYDDPYWQLNIIVTDVFIGGVPWSRSTLPQNEDPREFSGGQLMSTLAPIQWGPDLSQHTLSHELGHIFGLLHTYWGYSELPCGHQCSENMGTGSADLLGDYCSDTPPQPWWGNPTFAGAIDTCSGLPFGNGPNHNFMNTGANNAKTYFSPQQVARMYCFIDMQMDTWKKNPAVSADTTFGSDSLTVAFTASPHDFDTAQSWLWDFGDGGSATEASPVHHFDSPGTYSVTADLTTTMGKTYTTWKYSLIVIEADTVRADSASAEPGETVKVDLIVRNFVPLSQLKIPFSWSGPVDLAFDSVSTEGLRTDPLPGKQFTFFNGGTKQATYVFTAAGAEYLAPDSRAVLSLFFTIDPDAMPGSTTPITVGPFGTQELSFETTVATYEPDIAAGAVTVVNCCEGITGNVNDDPEENVSLSDLTVLVNHLFVTFEPLACPAEANTSGDPAGELTLSDLTALVNSLFVTFGPLPACQ